ncbi:MAG TPA: hypothetical protein VHE55_04125 [Fimbriimonadaceae bacterium]|nr:hypothetical protein [Fimbriimonadaceae bacterium]
MRSLFLCLCLLIAGCSGGGGIAGTYHAQGSLRQMILNADGTFRIMYGERTSPADVSGTYRRVGDTIVFSAKSGEAEGKALKTPLPEAKITEDGLSLGQERFRKT